MYRGLLALYSDQSDKALADIKQAADLDPKDPLHALWLDIIGQRNNLPSRLEETAKQLDLTKWPGPIIKLYLGQSTPAEVLAAVEGKTRRAKNSQTCQANFYSAVWALHQESKQEAKEEAARLFKLAANDCLKSTIEWRAAKAELKALEAAPPAAQAEASTKEQAPETSKEQPKEQPKE